MAIYSGGHSAGNCYFYFVRDAAVGWTTRGALLGHANQLREVAARMRCATPLTPVGAETRLEEELVGHRRGPRRLLHALAEAAQIRAILGSRRRTARRIRGARRAADDLVVT